MALSILEALAKLDAKNDNHWLADGQPRVETVRFLAGNQKIMREDILKMSAFSRSDAQAGKAPEPISSAPPAPPATTSDVTSPAVQSPPAPPATPPAPPPSSPSPPVTETAVAPAAAPPAAPAAEPEFNLEAAQKELESLEMEKVISDAALVAALKRRDELNSKIDPLRELIKKHLPPDTNSNAIQQYLASQQEILRKRGDQLRRSQEFTAETGVKLRDLLPKRAPIDEALARKTGRGTSRPK